MAKRFERAPATVDSPWYELPADVSTMDLPLGLDPVEGERWNYVLDSEVEKELLVVFDRLRDRLHALMGEAHPATGYIPWVTATVSYDPAARWVTATVPYDPAARWVTATVPYDPAARWVTGFPAVRSCSPGLSQTRLAPLRRSLEQLRSLRADWNGYEAEPPSERAIRQADSFLSMLEDHHPAPSRVSPSAEGGVSVFFRSGTKRYAWVEFFNDGEAVAATSDGEGRVDAWTLLTDDTAEDVEALTLEETLERIGAFLSAPA